MRWARPWSRQEQHPPCQRLRANVDCQNWTVGLSEFPELTVHIRSPQGQVVPQELHDQSRVPADCSPLATMYVPSSEVGPTTHL